MENIDIISLLGWISAAVGSLGGWFAGKHKRESDAVTANTDSIRAMQDTVDMLVEKNGQLTNKIAELNEKIVEQNGIITELKKQLAMMSEHNDEYDPC
jgi:TolA-binding protein